MLDLLKPSEGPMKVRGQSKAKPVAAGFAKVEHFCFAQSCNLKEKGVKSAKLVGSSVGAFCLLKMNFSLT